MPDAFRLSGRRPQASAQARPAWHARMGVVLFVLALLLAQTLGFVHRTLHHAPVGGKAAVTASVHHGLGASLFQHSEDDPSCRLFDQAAGGDTLPGVPAVVLPLAVAPLALLFFAGEYLARWVALFDARGPPAVR
jgi:hypothetical protein